MPDGRTGGSSGGISSGPLFQISPSQDLLAQTSTQDISTGFSQSGVCTSTLHVHVHAHVCNSYSTEPGIYGNVNEPCPRATPSDSVRLLP